MKYGEIVYNNDGRCYDRQCYVVVSKADEDVIQVVPFFNKKNKNFKQQPSDVEIFFNNQYKQEKECRVAKISHILSIDKNNCNETGILIDGQSMDNLINGINDCLYRF